MPKLLPPSPFIALIGAIFVAIITAIAAVIFLFNPYAESEVITPTPQSEETSTSTSNCGQVSESLVPECCEAWATDNDIVRINCVGNWQIQDDQCAYVCATEPLE